jgi:hypothetical protein
LIVLPTRTDSAYYDFSIELDGALYRFDFRWNERAYSWFCSLFDSEDSPIRQGMRVRPGLPLLMYVSDARKPPGLLLPVDTTGKNTPPGLTELGTRVLIYYFSAAERAEALGG